VELSSEDDQVKDLLSADHENEYWESDGAQGEHWMRFHMKPGQSVMKAPINHIHFHIINIQCITYATTHMRGVLYIKYVWV